MTRWEKNDEGNLVGSIETPMAVGIVGGASKVHPAVRANLSILSKIRTRTCINGGCCGNCSKPGSNACTSNKWNTSRTHEVTCT